MRKTEGICCICMQNCLNVENISISNDGNNKTTYSEKLKICIPNEIWSDDFNICKKCINKLDAAYDFVQICLKSEEFRKEKLRILLESAEEETKSSNLISNTEQVFCCDNCGKSFLTKRVLKQHITKIHSNPKKGRKSKRCSVKLETASDTTENKEELSAIDEKVEILIEDTSVELKLESQEELKLEESNKENTTENTLESEKDIPYDETSDVEDTYDPNTELNDENYCTDSDDQDEDLKPDLKGKPTGKKRGRKSRGPLKCPYCELIFSKKQLWSAHIRSKHTFERPFACDICDARYMNSYSLLIHKRKHNNEKPFICATCGKSFVSSADLNHHQKIHNLTRDYPCTQCDKSFKTHSNLRTHRLQMHLDPAEWKFPCTVCDKKFPIRSNLVKHLKRHAGIKDFLCHICDKKFINKAELNLHLNSHTNERLFKCSLCQKEYKNREGLRRHMKVVHDMGNWKAPKVEKKYLCPMCPKIFAFSAKLQRHIFSHTGEKPYKCDYCTKRFIDNYNRKVHIRKDHYNIEFLNN